MIVGLLRARRSVAALEFGVIAPVLIMAFAGVVDLGNALYTWSKLEQALALGANYALMKKVGLIHLTERVRPTTSRPRSPRALQDRGERHGSGERWTDRDRDQRRHASGQRHGLECR